jgi:general secretion pathway protein D
MDQSAVQETDVVALKYAVPSDVVACWKKLNDPSRRRPARRKPEVLLVAGQAHQQRAGHRRRDAARAHAQAHRLPRYPAGADRQRQGGLPRVRAGHRDRRGADPGHAEHRQASTARTARPTVPRAARRPSRPTRAPTALIITADADEMAALESVIQRLDIRRAQVLVEAIIVEMEMIDGAGPRPAVAVRQRQDGALRQQHQRRRTPVPAISPAPSCRPDGG